MRTVYIDHPGSTGARPPRHRFSFTGDRRTPSGIEARLALEGMHIGVVRGIDMAGPRGGTVRMWEVQLESRIVAHGNSLPVALTRILPDALREAGIHGDAPVNR